VDFVVGKGRINIDTTSQIEDMPLVGGFQKGDRVRSLTDFASHHLVKGDVSTVMGPGTTAECGQAGRVCVEFGAGKGRIDIGAKIQIEHIMSLAGGFQKGDRVRSRIDSASHYLVKGDVGTVMGPGTTTECGQAGVCAWNSGRTREE